MTLANKKMDELKLSANQEELKGPGYGGHNKQNSSTATVTEYRLFNHDQ
jgi:hypothetical protein